MLDALQLFGKFETELLGFIVGQPVGHLRKHYLMVTVSTKVPRCFILSGLGEREQSSKLQPDFFWIDLRRIRASILQPET